MHPIEERCWRLVQRGLARGLAAELRWCGDESLIAKAEQASDNDLTALNAEWIKRLHDERTRA